MGSSYVAMSIYCAQTSNCALQRRHAYIIQEGAVSSAKQDMWVCGSELEVSLVFTLEEIPTDAVHCSLGIGGIRILSCAIMSATATYKNSSSIIRHG